MTAQEKDLNHLIAEARERFRQNLPLEPGHPVRPDILRSWQRCKELGVKALAQAGRWVPPEDFKRICRENSALLDVAIPAIDNFYENIRGSDTNMILTDSAGIILYSRGVGTGFGDQPACSVRGLDIGEGVDGTTAMNLCLAEREAVSVTGAEHYKSMFDNWHCSAAPIWDFSGALIGSVALVIHRDELHMHTFGMAATLSSAISEQIKLRMLLEDHRTILELLNEAVIVLDKNNCVKEINPYACKIFNTTSSALGSQVGEIIRNKESITKLRGLAPVSDQDTTFTLRDGAQLHSSLSASRTTDGGLIINLRERRRIQHVAKSYINATAKYNFKDILGESPGMKQAKQLAQAAGRHDAAVLILGESGVGKELFAQAVHNGSARRKGPFIAINCGAIPRDLVQSELFGYEQGAFTGASREGRLGKFEMADGGTLFLDEIGDMPLNMQVNLLRVLQEGSVTRVGGKVQRKVNVRVIAATHHNLPEEVKTGAFRQDLYYRLNVVSINIPPLRERVSDICMLAGIFLQRYQNTFGKHILGFDEEVMEYLELYSWPGNVRELENVIERAVIVTSGSYIQKQDLPLELIARIPPGARALGPSPEQHDSPLGEALHVTANGRLLREQEEGIIISTLSETGGNLRAAAKILGLSRGTLYSRLKRYGIEPDSLR